MTRDKKNLNKWQRENYQKKKADPDYVAKRKASAQKYYQNNKAKIQARSKKYHDANIDKYRAYRRDYKSYNPRGIFSSVKSGAKKRGITVAFTIDEFEKWWNEQPQICFYCKRPFELIKSLNDSVNNRAKRLTIDRIDNLQGYSLGNIRLACYRCNQIKGDYFTEAEMLKIGEIINAKPD